MNGSDPSADDNGVGADASPGPSGNVDPASDVGVSSADSSNAEDASADGDGSAPAEQTATVDQAASATAEADQDGAGNSNTTVRVGEAGDGPGVVQENTAAADAVAHVSVTTPATNQSAAPDPSVPGSAAGAATVAQQVGADATATQVDTSNLNVSVRVLSPGDDGPVSQANTATASATVGGSNAPSGAGASASGSGVSATASQLGVSNTNVAVRVFSPGDGGGVRQTNTAAAEAATDPDQGPVTGPSSFMGANASATQAGVSNTNVSIRVGSPGSDGATVQANGNGQNVPQNGLGTGVSVEGAGSQTNLFVNVNGNDVPVPLASNGALTVWRWTWTWDGRGIPTDISSWDWNWDGSDPSLSGEGTVTSEQAPAGLTAGTWIWNWQWSRPDGQAWDWAPPGLSVDCACVWIWDWSWNWAVEPAAASTPTSDDAAPVDGGAAVTQSNLVTAGAYATAEATIDGSVDQAPSGLVSVDQAAPSGLASLGLVSVFAGQIVTVDQEVSATARAVQSGVSNVAYGWKRVAQANTVEGVAVADAAATAVQGVAQGHEREVGPSRGEGGVDQWAGQQIEVSQTATADADASQSHIVGKSPVSRSAVVVRAAASAVVVVQQEIEQESVVGRGDHDLWAGQLFQAAQIADASAAGAQSDDEIDPGVVRPSSRVARSTAAALAAAYSLQSARQLAAGAGDTSQIAQQLVQVLQGSAAHAATIQPPRSPVGGDGESLATTDADASGRAFMEELSTQASIEGGEQETTQNISILQLADATSSAIGGVSGGGRVVNCATVGQSSQQAIGLDAFGVALTDATTFCTPAADDPGTTEAAAPAAEPLAAEHRRVHGHRPDEVLCEIVAPGAGAAAGGASLQRGSAGSEGRVPGADSAVQRRCLGITDFDAKRGEGPRSGRPSVSASDKPTGAHHSRRNPAPLTEPDPQPRRQAPGLEAGWPCWPPAASPRRRATWWRGPIRPSGGRSITPDGSKRPGSSPAFNSCHSRPGPGRGNFHNSECSEGSKVSKKILLLGAVAVGLLIPSSALAGNFKGFNPADLKANIQSSIQSATVTQGGTAQSGAATGGSASSTSGSGSGGAGGTSNTGAQGANGQTVQSTGGSSNGTESGDVKGGNTVSLGNSGGDAKNENSVKTDVDNGNSASGGDAKGANGGLAVAANVNLEGDNKSAGGDASNDCGVKLGGCVVQGGNDGGGSTADLRPRRRRQQHVGLGRRQRLRERWRLQRRLVVVQLCWRQREQLR